MIVAPNSKGSVVFAPILAMAMAALKVESISALEKVDFSRQNRREKATTRFNNTSPTGDTDEIIGGDVYPPGTRDYLVALGDGFFDGALDFVCGGTLISPNAVLTAAHCVVCLGRGTSTPTSSPIVNAPSFSPTTPIPTFSPTTELPTSSTSIPTFSSTNECIGGDYDPIDSIDFGRYDLRDPVSPPIQRFGVCQEFCNDDGVCADDASLACVVSHPDYKWQVNYDDLFDNDVAVILLPEPVTNIVPIALNNNPDTPESGDVLEAIGWGETEDDFFPYLPSTVNVNYMTNEECVDPNGPPDGYFPQWVTENMLCAAAPGKDACFGDSGGPLFANTGAGPIQMGIKSWGGFECADPVFPGVYTRISSVYGWIKDTICARFDDDEVFCTVQSPTSSPSQAPTPKPTPRPTTTTKQPTSRPTSPTPPTVNAQNDVFTVQCIYYPGQSWHTTCTTLSGDSFLQVLKNDSAFPDNNVPLFVDSLTQPQDENNGLFTISGDRKALVYTPSSTNGETTAVCTYRVCTKSRDVCDSAEVKVTVRTAEET